MKTIDAFQMAFDKTLESDICIIGAGAAGIAIAREFKDTHFQVLLLESGDFSYNEKTQSLYDIENIGHPLRMQKGYVSRNRRFGGSTNTWAGQCVPFNDIDFEKRPWISESGWPIKKVDLDPFYKQASGVLNLPNFELFNINSWRNKLVKNSSHFLFEDEAVTPEVCLWATNPINMGLANKKLLENSSNIRVVINANVTEIESSKNFLTVDKLHVCNLNKQRFFVKAKVYVLACGGWENARLLLLSNRHCSSGLGNQHDVVGRYYIEHPKIRLGIIFAATDVLRSPILLRRQNVRRGTAQLGIRLSDDVQRREKLLNHYILLSPDYPAGMSEAYDDIRSLGRQLKRLSLADTAKNELTNIISQFGKLTNDIARNYLNLPLPFETVSIFNHFEQMPNAESQITLSSQRDLLGLNKLKIDLRISNEDKYSLIRFHEILGSHLEKLEIGYLTSDISDEGNFWSELTDSSHHLGTTRMSDDPKKGVVDKHCKVHDINNLYIAGSSVFPTGGHANPTLTIVALALKLADHLKSSIN